MSNQQPGTYSLPGLKPSRRLRLARNQRWKLATPSSSASSAPIELHTKSNSASLGSLSRTRRYKTSAMKSATVDLRTSKGTCSSTKPARTSLKRCICCRDDSSPSKATGNIGWKSASFEPRPERLRTPCTMKLRRPPTSVSR